MSVLRPFVLASSAAALLALAASTAMAADGANATPDPQTGDGSVPINARGGDGDNGTEIGGVLTPAGKGGNGADVTIVTTSTLPLGSNIVVDASGGSGGSEGADPAGAGGAGGAGGDIAITVDEGNPNNIDAKSRGGNGGGGYGGAPSSNGGKAGDITIEVNVDLTGGIVATATGGASQSQRGEGGDIVVLVEGDIPEGIVLQTGNGQGYTGTNVPNIQIVVDGHIGVDTGKGRSIQFSGGPNGTAGGTATVTLLGDTVLDGAIYDTGNTVSTVIFSLTMTDAAAFNQAKLDLAAALGVTSGNVTINNHVYKWANIDNIIDDLRLAGVTTIVFTVGGGGSSSGAGDGGPSTPQYLSCTSRTVIAYADASGIVFNGKQPGTGTRFRVGSIGSGGFASDNPLGWTVVTGPDGMQVFDGNHELVATCTL